MSARAYDQRDGSEMTVYPDFAVEYRDASHMYWLHKDGERRRAVSVTSALKVLDKPPLVSWAERVGVEGALRLERAGSLKGVEVENAIGIVRECRMGADAKRDAGADRGSAVHEALRSYCALGTVPKVGDFPTEVRGYVKGLCRWLFDARPEPILVEQIVGSPRYGFAGRFDLLANLDGQRTLVDLKTSGPYPEHHLQMAAYRTALVECGDHAERSLVVSVSEDGGFTPVDGVADAEDYLAVFDCHRAMGRVRRAITAAEKTEEVAA